ncbi:MAG: antitoxin Xre-like helix-turn-helix domain-containing protein [Gemmatimonadales bacterium]
MVFRAPPASAIATAPNGLNAAHLARAGLATFFRIGDEWKLDTAQQAALLGLVSRTTFFRWKKSPPASLPPDTLERLSHVFGIYKSLQILLPAELAAGWVHRPNDAPLFGGRPAVELMLGGVAGLFLVRAYLDGERGGDFA